jgi:predicted RNA-binding Zn ribbon-like protein
MRETPTPKPPFEFIAGNCCLDFANTLDNRGDPHPKELLTEYSQLLRWGEESGLITRKTAERLRVAGQHSPARAQSTLHEAIQLREAIYHVFAAVAQRQSVPAAQLAILNKAIHNATQQLQIVRGNGGFTWDWISPDASLDSVLWPVARAAGELLTSEDLIFVGRCASDTCAWLFLDKTKNHRRRWCEMKVCGNRAKAKRYYERQKTE